MKMNKEAIALLNLLDDNEPIVKNEITKRIIEIGSPFIPLLENTWENTIDLNTQFFIESIIHKIEFNELSKEIKNWTGDGYKDLLKGSILISKYCYPHLSETTVNQQFENLKRKIWLELNHYLTPLEKCSVLCKMLFEFEGYRCTGLNYSKGEEFLIHKLFETKKGNMYSFGLLLQILCDALDINANIINLENQMILAFYHSDFYSFNLTGDHRNHIHFYLDAHTGEIVLLQDIEQFFEQSNFAPLTNKSFYPMEHKQIIYSCFSEYARTFFQSNELYKKEEILDLANILNK